MVPKIKHCPFCDEEIKYAARKCKHCGEYLDEELYQESLADQEFFQQPQTIKKWNPGVAALISLIIPGGGQMYKGQILWGILWLIFVVIGYLFFLIPGLVLHIICIANAASGNPYQSITEIPSYNRKRNEMRNFDPNTIKLLLILTGLFFLALIANRINEKGIGNFFQNSDSGTEEKIPNSKPDYTEARLDSIKQRKKHLNGLETSAISASRRYVREILKFPKTADFPIFDITSKHMGDSIFIIQSYVESQNAFGVVGTLYYDAKIKYLGGNTHEPSSWLLIDLKTGDHR